MVTLFARFENAKCENQKGSWSAVQNMPVHDDDLNVYPLQGVVMSGNLRRLLVIVL